MRARLAAAMIGAGLSHGALAQTGTEACLKIEPDLDRLACYDQAAGRTPKTLTVAPKGADFPWETKLATSKLTDSQTVYLSVKSEEEVGCRFRPASKIIVMIRCMEKATSIFFATGCHMASSEYNDYGHVTYRLDTQKAGVAKMAASTDNRALGHWSGGGAIPLIKQIMGRSRLVVRMTPYGESPFTATFNVAGLDEAIKPLRKACQW